LVEFFDFKVGIVLVNTIIAEKTMLVEKTVSEELGESHPRSPILILLLCYTVTYEDKAKSRTLYTTSPSFSTTKVSIGK
jgi:hypothetical protein